MAQEEYMLILGANIYANSEYTVLYQADIDSDEKTTLFNLENSENGLILTSEIQDESSNLIAKIDKNEPLQVNEKFDVQGKIEDGSGFTLKRVDNGAVVLNARITDDGYVAVTGIFHVKGKKIYIASRAVEIDDMPRQTINGVNVHDSFFVGTSIITLTNNGVVLSSDRCCK